MTTAHVAGHRCLSCGQSASTDPYEGRIVVRVAADTDRRPLLLDGWPSTLTNTEVVLRLDRNQLGSRPDDLAHLAALALELTRDRPAGLHITGGSPAIRGRLGLVLAAAHSEESQERCAVTVALPRGGGSAVVPRPYASRRTEPPRG